MRGRLLTIVKLAGVAVLLWIVIANVQWVDQKRHLEADGSVRSEQPGKIEGDWDTETVRFAVRDGDGSTGPAVPVRTGRQPDGSNVEVLPGFFTYVLRLDVTMALLGAACYFLSVAFASTRWWWLLRVNQLDVTWYEAWRFTWIGVFFNNVVPGQTGGDVAKAVYIMKHCHGGRVPALVSVLVDRVMGLGSLALLAAVVVLFALDRYHQLALGIYGVLAVVGVVGIIAFSKRIRRFVRLDELLRRLPAFLSGPLQRIDQAVHFYRDHKGGIGLWMLLGMLNHVVSVLSVLLFGLALGIGLPTFEYFVLVPVTNIVAAIPLGPNGWGLGEISYRYLFEKFGGPFLQGQVSDPGFVMGTRGVALSIAYRLHMTLQSLLGGLLMLFEKDRVTRADLADEVAREHDEVQPSGG